jgi:hypothetical protein
VFDDLPPQHKRHVAWLEYPIQQWPEDALYEMQDPELLAIYLEVEKRITQSVALQKEWGIPFTVLTPMTFEIPDTAHPIDRAWYALHHYWIVLMQIMSREQATKLADTHMQRREKHRAEIVQAFKKAEAALDRLEKAS